MSTRVCAVVGVGPGNGAALARRFAKHGYRVALLARDAAKLERLAAQLPGALPVMCDVSHEESVVEAFASVHRTLGPVDTLLYNAGNYVRGFADAKPASLLEAFRVNALGCLLAVQQVLPAMRQRKAGQIVVMGATASLRGAAGSLPFATAKAGQRAMVQSLARELGPQGIHVSYVVIDAVIDSPKMRLLFPCRGPDGFAQSEHIADTVAQLVAQPRSAWTFELDLRPFSEKW